MRNQPSTIGVAVPSARVSKKPEVFPGKIVCATVENTKADNPNPETTIPVTVVLYTQETVSTVEFVDGIGTDDCAGETFRNSVQRPEISCVAAHSRKKLKQYECK